MSVRKATAIITGASSGIGRSLAVHLGQRQQYKLALVARNVRQLELTSQMVKDAVQKVDKSVSETTLNDMCAEFPCDLTDPRQVEQTMNDIGQNYGPLQLLVNNAGTATSGKLEDQSMEVWDQLLDINLSSVVRCTKHCLPYLKESAGLRHGEICGDPSLINSCGIPSVAVINISSLAGTDQAFGCERSVYSAAKSGVRTFSKCLFDDIQDTGIKVSCICPHATDTPLIDQCERNAHFRQHSDLMISTQDICDTVDYILQSSASACPIEVVIRAQYSIQNLKSN